MVLDSAARGVGIIPARAGFTGPTPEQSSYKPDHPRSRGVYSVVCPSMVNSRGSSPLARGLQPAVTPAIPPRRIIPARAGFTGGWRSPARTSPDHPRSRGVYLLVAVIGGVGTGSSPLARGLPTFMGDMMSRPPDHPRSRGVYGGKAMSGSAATGSSPLARGLHRAAQSYVRRRRIIPARAGFTATKEAAKPENRDHPRSRGVYFRPVHLVL
mgnify:CR=1 FL=1